MFRLQARLILPFAVLLAGSSAYAQTVLSANITNASENPVTNPTLSTGGARPASFGTATFVLNSTNTAMTFTATIFNVDFTGTQTADVNDNLTAAHIHAGPAVSPTVNGGVVWGFFGAPLNDNNPNDVVVTPFTNGVGGTISGKWDAPEGNNTTLAAQLPFILSGRSYINFHTKEFGGGELRGFLTLAPGISSSGILPVGTVGTPYSQTLAASGGATPYAWTVTSGTLPNGISLSSAGVLSGTPTQAVSSKFTATATGSATSFSSKAFTLSILPTSLNTTSVEVPHIVDAANFITQFTIVNLDTAPVSFQFKFWDDNGAPLAFPMQDGVAGSLAGTLVPGGTWFAQSAGTSAPLTQGWAEVAANGRISVLENSFRSSASGGSDTEASVMGMPSVASFTLPFDNTQGSVSGAAVSNTNGTQSIVVTVTITPENGTPTSTTLVLPAHGHSAFVLPVAYPTTAGIRGSIRFSTPFSDLAAMGLRFGPKNSISSLGGSQ